MPTTIDPAAVKELAQEIVEAEQRGYRAGWAACNAMHRKEIEMQGDGLTGFENIGVEAVRKAMGGGE